MLHSLVFALLPTTWIVDAANGPGTNFLDLPAAIAAASDGDTILVRAGTYSPFTITGKNLQIRGAGAAATLVDALVAGAGPAHAISASPDGIGSVLAGLRIRGGLQLHGQANVTLLDCVLQGTDAVQQGGLALSVIQSSVAWAQGCRFEGGSGLPFSLPPGVTPINGGPAVVVYQGRLAASDCDFVGGDSVVVAPLTAPAGGNGLTVTVSAQVRLDHCRLRGGDGGTPPMSGSPGIGIDVSNDSHLQLDAFSSDVVAGGFGVMLGFPYQGTAMRLVNQVWLPPATLHVHGAPSVQGTVTGTVTFGAPDLPTLAVAATTLPSGETDALQPVTVTFDGLVPLQPFALLLGLQPVYGPVGPPLVGDLLLDLGSAGFQVGLLDAAGQFQFGFVPALVFGGGVPLPVLAQAAVFEASGQVRLSNRDARYYSL
ncbi:MAG: hypothetical protein JNL08_07300 [Planctomycetes bacterium]|nr:hypothetical protein [Planctomycetota bacterium]